MMREMNGGHCTSRACGERPAVDGGGVTRHRACRHRLYFFFQAEDGIRDYKVTGVQTCALPIFIPGLRADHEHPLINPLRLVSHATALSRDRMSFATYQVAPRREKFKVGPLLRKEIGRASCRERV